jgi:hypothetical protein
MILSCLYHAVKDYFISNKISLMVHFSKAGRHRGSDLLYYPYPV